VDGLIMPSFQPPASDDTDGTWAYAWPAGERLLAEFDAVVGLLAGRRVIDLGCGRGRLGLAALARGAQVAFADGSAAALAQVRAALPMDADARILLHRWGEPLPAADLLLGGDILYRSALFPDLIASVASAGCPALLADPRTSLESELPELAAMHGMHWSSERRPGGYTLARLAPVAQAAAG
jgi:predicted nicotinamide N-methyase